MRALFIYYRVPAADAPAAEPHIRAAQSRLVAAHPALMAELWRRPEEKDGLQTWMEVYRHPCGVSEALQAEIERAMGAATRWIVGERHVEVFVPCVS